MTSVKWRVLKLLIAFDSTVRRNSNNKDISYCLQWLLYANASAGSQVHELSAVEMSDRATKTLLTTDDGNRTEASASNSTALSADHLDGDWTHWLKRLLEKSPSKLTFRLIETLNNSENSA